MPHLRPAARNAFTVIELMLAIILMGVIIYALYNVFNQTQKALRASETQTDLSERARVIAEMIARELEQAHPAFSFTPIPPGTTNFIKEVNMLGGLELLYTPLAQGAVLSGSQMRSDIQPRTNYIHNIFFYNNRTNAWQGIGYRVVYFTNGVGALQRFETNLFGHKPISNLLSTAFLSAPLTNVNYHHVADGVIHLTFVPFDKNGRRLGWDTTNLPPEYRIIRRRVDGTVIQQYSTDNPINTNLHNALLREGTPQATPAGLQYTTSFSFLSNALPAYIEMELGILEPDTLTQYYLMLEEQNPSATNFLARQISRVHLFRQRIPIRTAAQ